MLIKTKYLNFNSQYAYAPPQEDTIINLDNVCSVDAIDGNDIRGSGPFVKVNFKDGKHKICVGTVNDFMQQTYIKNREATKMNPKQLEILKKFVNVDTDQFRHTLDKILVDAADSATDINDTFIIQLTQRLVGEFGVLETIQRLCADYIETPKNVS